MKRLACLLALLASTAQAANLHCSGTARGTRIVVTARGTLMNPDAGAGSVVVAGRLVARFDGEDVNLNYLTKSMRARNAHGDIVEARVTNLNRGTGMINRLVVPAFGISYARVPVQCRLLR